MARIFVATGEQVISQKTSVFRIMLWSAMVGISGCSNNSSNSTSEPQPRPSTSTPTAPTQSGAPAPTPSPSDTYSDMAVQLQGCSNIMPLGDSITIGVNGGYRNNLFTGLEQNNCGVSYVGNEFDQATRVADKDHEGHSQFNIKRIGESVNNWVASSQPNIILLMIGTNDTAWWTTESANDIGVRHNALIDQLRTLRPNAWIFVASIPPQTSLNIPPSNIDRAQLTQQFNQVIRANVEARIAAGERVRFVDVNSVLTTTTADLYDGIHPTEEGHAKIANKFLEAIRATLVSP